MTNYNERLDEVFETLNNKAREERASCTERNNWEGYTSAYKKLESDAKQAITLLIKELVAEAQPKIDLLDIGVLTGGTIAVDKLGRKNIHAPKDEQKFADSSTIEAHQAAYMVAYKLSSDIFEQNLLKELEEV